MRLARSLNEEFEFPTWDVRRGCAMEVGKGSRNVKRERDGNEGEEEKLVRKARGSLREASAEQKGQAGASECRDWATQAGVLIYQSDCSFSTACFSGSCCA
jgi:hypothetical protein